MLTPALSTLDTIVAVASPPGVSERAIVRISGSEAWPLLASHSDVAPDRPVRGFEGCALELQVDGFRVAAWASFFRAPRSYTTEDLIELHIPGAVPLTAAVVRVFCSVDGVRAAGPGEFTLRAFLGGRIDLSRAEAVEQLISASGEAEARAARRTLGGELERRVRSVVDALAESIALLEAALDFPDEDLPEIAPRPVLDRLSRVADDIVALRESSSLRLAASGTLHIAIAGFPNAGKSSLLNAVSARPSALVSDLAGTTRDPVRVDTEHGERRLQWVDLAGATDYAEEAGRGLESQLDDDAMRMLRRLCRVELEGADLVLWVTDAQEGATSSASLEAMKRVAPDALAVLNKADLLSVAELEAWRARLPEGAVMLSAQTGAGLDELIDAVLERLGGESGELVDGVSPATAHQEAALIEADEASSRACRVLERGEGYEFAAADLRLALHALREIGGEVTNEDILGHIFSRFCVGK